MSSVTQAPSRTVPSSSIAWAQSSSWNNNKASLTLALTGWPIEYSMFASMRPPTKPWVAPAESARTRMWWTTRPGSSPGSWPSLVLGRQRGDRLVQQLEVVVGVVRAGVARTQHRRERLGGRVAPRPEGMEAEAALVGRRGVLLLGVDVEQRGVEVDRDVARRRRCPDDLPRCCDRLWDRAQLERAVALHRPPGGRDRGDRRRTARACSRSAVEVRAGSPPRRRSRRRDG